MISMVGLLIGVGLMMDDAIVIAENIAARMAEGDAAIDAAVSGVKQVLPGIMSSFATTIMVFGSLAFISGEIGQILRVMPIVLIVVLAVSLLEAFLILPHHLAHSLGRAQTAASLRFRLAFDRYFELFRRTVFDPLLDRSMEYRYLTAGVIALLVIVSVAMPAGGKLKFVGFPSLDGDVLEARVLLPQGTPLARTEQVVAVLEAALGPIKFD